MGQGGLGRRRWQRGPRPQAGGFCVLSNGCCYDRFMPISFQRSLCLAATLGVGLFGQSGACTSTVTRQLEVFPLTSATLHNTRKLRVWLPPGYHDAANAAKKYPVLYILDGDSAFDACTAFRHQEVRADETLTELIASGRMPPVIVVGIDSASAALDYNAAGESPDKGEERAREFLAYPDPFSWPGLRDVRGAEFPTFLEHEVMPMTERVRQLVLARADSVAISRQAAADGMLTLRESAIRKMALGLTSFAEVVRVTIEAD